MESQPKAIYGSVSAFVWFPGVENGFLRVRIYVWSSALFPPSTDFDSFVFSASHILTKCKDAKPTIMNRLMCVCVCVSDIIYLQKALLSINFQSNNGTPVHPHQTNYVRIIEDPIKLDGI